MLIPYKGKLPDIHPSAFIAEGAVIAGDVVIGEDCSIWFNSVVRGDVNYIRIGKGNRYASITIGKCTRHWQDNDHLHVLCGAS